jgi:hypothetical protein
MPCPAAIAADMAELPAVAATLNKEEVGARKGGLWSATQVKRVLDRAAGKVPYRRRPTA